MLWAKCFDSFQLLHELCVLGFGLASWNIIVDVYGNFEVRRLLSPVLCHTILEKPVPCVLVIVVK